MRSQLNNLVLPHPYSEKIPPRGEQVTEELATTRRLQVDVLNLQAQLKRYRDLTLEMLSISTARTHLDGMLWVRRDVGGPEGATRDPSLGLSAALLES